LSYFRDLIVERRAKKVPVWQECSRLLCLRSVQDAINGGPMSIPHVPTGSRQRA
jgi:hypothetical protein